MAEMVKITLDGEEIEVEAGKTILQAALTQGREIPHYCYHDGLSIAGNCRMCLVEVEKMPKLAIGCYTPVADGMVVHTKNERVKQAQQAVMEFLLINHPLDCPICDQAGECRLQDYAVSFGTGKSRYTESKLALAKAVDIGKHVMLDQDRCIQCSRCIRFCDEVTGTGELAFFQRGNKAQIGLHPGKRLDNDYSGNTVDICPVGALTLKEFRFQTRVWYLDNTPSVCALCARGCNVVVSTGTQNVNFTSPGQFDDRIKRIVPRVNEDVNGHWMCDEGRLSADRLEAAPRLERSQVPPGTDTEWEDATSTVAMALRDAAAAGKAGAILSPRLTVEDLFAWRELFEALGGFKVAVRRIERGENDNILVRADKGANSTGAGWIFGDAIDEAALLGSAAAGELDALLIVGDPLDPGDIPVVDAGTREKLQHLIQVGPFVAGSAERATALLPSATWSEADGHYVNFEGRIQRVRRAHRPRGEGRPGWRVVADLAEAAGLEWPAWTDSDDVFRALSAKVSQFENIDPDLVGLLGVSGRADATLGV
jgi:NADH-quinone oxidoreductase subunit G